MAFNQMDNFTFAHSNQIDAIYTQYTAQQIKSLFDSRGDELRTALNLLITSLNSVNGASNIGTSTIQDIDGANIQLMLQSIRDKLKSKIDGASGADYVNATAIAGLTGETVQSLLESMKSYVDGLSADKISAAPIAVGSGNTIQQQLAWLLSQIAIAATGSIPDGSLGEIKLTQALIDKINTALSNTGVLTTLTTVNKSSSVNAINEVNNNFMSHQADDVNHIPYAVATGSANTYAVTLNPVPTSYIKGMAVCVEINVASTGASTLNINGLGTKTILDSLGNAITSGGLKAGVPYTLRYNGTNFIVQGKGGGGNATSDKLLSPYTATVDTGQIIGTMPNNGAINVTQTTSGQITTIPAGYTPGGQVTNNITIASLGGKRWASGTVTASSSTSNFTYINGSTNAFNYVTVTGLNFKPSTIYLKCLNVSVLTSFYDEISSNDLYSKPIKVCNAYNSASYTGITTYHIKGDVAPASIVTGSFTMPVVGNNLVYNWIAFE